MRTIDTIKKLINSTSLAALLLILGFLSLQTVADQPTADSGAVASGFRIWMLDIGQGDSFLVESGDGGVGLVDTGAGRVVVDQLARVLGSRKQLDFVLLTHPDADHVEGFIALADYYEIGQVMLSGASKDTGVWQEVQQQIANYNIPISIINSSNDFTLGCCIRFDVLWPLSGDKQVNYEDVNDLSIAFMLVSGNFSGYFGGDLGTPFELESIVGTQYKDIDLLKVGHHGSSSSSDPAFLQIISPQVALISVGEKNRYGHPTAAVLQSLADIGARVWRTDQEGLVEVDIEPEEMVIKSERGLEEMRIPL